MFFGVDGPFPGGYMVFISNSRNAAEPNYAVNVHSKGFD